MKTILIILSTLLVACSTYPPVENPTKLPFKFGNDCLPQAIIMTEALKEKNVEARVLRIYTKKWGHAVCVYMYPKGQNQLWVWDRIWMSLRLRAWKDDPDSIGKAWLEKTYPEQTFDYAEFD